MRETRLAAAVRGASRSTTRTSCSCRNSPVNETRQGAGRRQPRRVARLFGGLSRHGDQIVSACRRSRCRCAHAWRQAGSPARKSALMPIDRWGMPLRRAMSASRAKCGEAWSSKGGMHIRPAISSPCTVRQRAMKASASLRQHAGFLRFGAGIHLDVEARKFAASGHFCAQRCSDPFAIDRLDHVEDGERVAHLVRLQWSDQVQFGVGPALLECRPFRLRLLHPVLAEDALACRQHRPDRLGWEGFRDADERDSRALPAGIGSGACHPRPDHGKRVGCGTSTLQTSVCAAYDPAYACRTARDATPFIRPDTTNHGYRALQRPRGRTEMAGAVGGARVVCGRAAKRPSEILRARNVPVPIGTNPHGPRPQLCDGGT